MQRRLPDDGVCGFVRVDRTRSPFVIWAPRALPSVLTLADAPAEAVDPKFQLPLPIGSLLMVEATERVIDVNGTVFRLHVDAVGTGPPAILLPLDRLFEIRAAEAIRLWRGLSGRNPGPSPAMLSKPRRDRLVLTLRALDGRLEAASYREIAGTLFGIGEVPERGWKSHDLRDRTIRLVRSGLELMHSGYRRLLLHPYRRRP